MGLGAVGAKFVRPGTHRQYSRFISEFGQAGSGLLAPTPVIGGKPRTGLESAAAPSPGSPRARVLQRSTLNSVQMYLYTTAGRIGVEYTEEQIATVARLYDMLTWVYAGTGVSEAAHSANPDVIVTEYFDLTWVGDYDQAPGQPWMPAPWGYVNAHEQFFSHWSPTASPKTRIPNPIFGYGTAKSPESHQSNPTGTPHEWLANPFDIDPAKPANLDFWVNYFAARSGELISSSKMDGLMMDEVEQPYGVPPPFADNPWAWHKALEQDLAFIRDRLGKDMVLFWNGIFGDMALQPPHVRSIGPWARPASLDYYQWCDGAQMELFVTSYAGPQVWPEPIWEEILDLCMAMAKRGILLAQAPILAEDPLIRSFVLASFHLCKGERSYLSHRGGYNFPWFPEWTVQLGAPTFTAEHITGYRAVPAARRSGVSAASGVVYARPFELGLALANPSDAGASVWLAHPVYRVVPRGGGWIRADGTIPEGSIAYERVTRIDLPSRSGALAFWGKPRST